jgi:NADH:ubiquinone oxidoreductase subunit 5 (subunit L)/multisubunit Na+/H+ antiporter MnhA subunit
MSWLVRFVLVVLGILAVVVGVIYLVEPVHSLPSFFPGHALHGQGHHRIRGYIAIAVGIILLIFARIARGSRRRRH